MRALSAFSAILAIAIAASMGAGIAEAAKKKTYTAEQKKKMYAEAMKICRKTGYHVVRADINWTTLKITCWYR